MLHRVSDLGRFDGKLVIGFRPGEGSSNRMEKYQMRSFNALFSSRNINRVIKNDRRWAGHVARIGRRNMHTGFGGES
jgi:hypothetical protein